MSEEQNHLRIHLCDGVAKISADWIHIEPRPTFTEDAIKQIRAIVREEIAAAGVMPDMTVTLEVGDDGITERVTRIAGEVTERFRLSR